MADIPDFIVLEFILNPQIKVKYFKEQRIVFISPPELVSSTEFKTLFDITSSIRERPSFPYSDWRVAEPLKNSYYKTAWLYELHIGKYHRQLAEERIALANKKRRRHYDSSDEEEDREEDEDDRYADERYADERHTTSHPSKNKSIRSGNGTKVTQITKNQDKTHVPPTSCVPTPIPPLHESTHAEHKLVHPFDSDDDNAWSSENIAAWIRSDSTPHLVVHSIPYFRRYGSDLKFEFLTVWESKQQFHTVWLKYTDIKCNQSCADFLSTRWKPTEEKLLHFEDDPHFDNDLSDLESVIEHPEDDEERRMKRSMIKLEKKRSKKEKEIKEIVKQKNLDDSDSDDSDSAEKTDVKVDPKSIVQKSGRSEGGNVGNGNGNGGNVNGGHGSTCETVVWLDIFDKSSVDPVPGYQVKQMKNTQPLSTNIICH